MGSDQSAGPESNEVARRLFEEAEHVHENSAGHSHEEHGHSKAGTAALALGALELSTETSAQVRCTHSKKRLQRSHTS